MIVEKWLHYILKVTLKSNEILFDVYIFFYRLFANYTLVCHSTSLCLCSLGCLLKACIFIKWSWLLLSVEAWWISTLLLGGVSLIYFQSTVILGLCRSGPLPGFDPEIRKYVNMYFHAINWNRFNRKQMTGKYWKI